MSAASLAAAALCAAVSAKRNRQNRILRPLNLVFGGAFLAVFIGLDSALAANKVATALMPGIVAGEAAIYSFVFGVLWSHYYDDAVYMPRISVVFACGFLMLAVILAATGYVKMINSKK